MAVHHQDKMQPKLQGVAEVFGIPTKKANYILHETFTMYISNTKIFCSVILNEQLIHFSINNNHAN